MQIGIDPQPFEINLLNKMIVFPSARIFWWHTAFRVDSRREGIHLSSSKIAWTSKHKGGPVSHPRMYLSWIDRLANSTCWHFLSLLRWGNKSLECEIGRALRIENTANPFWRKTCSQCWGNRVYVHHFDVCVECACERACVWVFVALWITNSGRAVGWQSH